MNIGELRKNDRGIFVGKIETVAVTMTLALNAVHSDNPNAPAYEVYALAKSRAWVKVGALWEKATRETSELFLQGNIDDPSMDRRLYIACFMREDGSYAIAWSRPRRNRGELPAGNGPNDDQGDVAANDDPVFPFENGGEAQPRRGRRQQSGSELGETTSDAAN